MKELLKKFMSRKFIMALLGAITGIATSLSSVGGEVGTVSGIVLTTVSIITYIYTEGKIDSANKQISLDIKNLTDEIIANINNIKKEVE